MFIGFKFMNMHVVATFWLYVYLEAWKFYFFLSHALILALKSLTYNV